MIIPELNLYKVISGILAHIKNDIVACQSDMTQSILYKLLHNVKLGDYDYYTEAVDLFSRGNDHRRKVGLSMFFDAQRVAVPTIHISLPGENGGAFDGIGVDEGYRSPDWVESGTPPITTGFRKYYTRSFDANYNIIITSDNTLEVLVIYHVLRAMMIAIFDTIEYVGMRKPVLGGQDLQINGDLVPPHIFIRAITFSCGYEIEVPDLLPTQIAHDIAIGTITIISE